MHCFFEKLAHIGSSKVTTVAESQVLVDSNFVASRGVGSFGVAQWFEVCEPWLLQ